MKKISLLYVVHNPLLRFMMIPPFILFLLFILTSAVFSPYFETNLMVREYQLTNSILGKICHQYSGHCQLYGDKRCFCLGDVTYSQKTGSLGKEGKVFLVVRYATAVDNTRVPLRANLSQTGDEKVALSWMVCPFIKGTSSIIPGGTDMTPKSK